MKNGVKYPSNKFNYKKIEFRPIYLKNKYKFADSFLNLIENDHEIKYLERKSSPIHFQSILMKSAKENLQKIKFKQKCTFRIFVGKSYL